jgi:hypothetical protein
MKKLGEGFAASNTEISADLFVNGKETVTIGDEETEMRVAALMLGTTVSMKNLKVKSVKPAQSSNALTIYCEVDGIEVQVHAPEMFDNFGQPITEETYLGKTFDIKGVVDVFYDVYQIEFYSLSDITFH